MKFLLRSWRVYFNDFTVARLKQILPDGRRLMVLLKLSSSIRRMWRVMMREAHWKLTQTGCSHRHKTGWRLSKIYLTVLTMIVCRLPTRLFFVLLLLLVVVLVVVLVMMVMIRADRSRLDRWLCNLLLETLKMPQNVGISQQTANGKIKI